MAYLESRRFVHRDLSARNILVGTDDSCIVSDFGLSRALRDDSDYYMVRANARMPVRWCAPEVINASRFSTASDVWAFFVLMWEVWSRGQQPFGSSTNLQVYKMLEKVADGKLNSVELLHRPPAVTPQLYVFLSSFFALRNRVPVLL